MLLTPYNTSRCRVFLDGVETNHVCLIDTDKNVAVRYCTDEDGGDFIRTEEIKFNTYELRSWDDCSRDD